MKLKVKSSLDDEIDYSHICVGDFFMKLFKKVNQMYEESVFCASTKQPKPKQQQTHLKFRY